MSQVLASESNLTNIANSIRAKLGVQTTYKPSEMSGAIDSISSSGGGDEDFIKYIEGGETSINLPSSITTIRAFCMYYEPTMQTINIPSGVTTVRGTAIADCPALTTITFLGTPTTISSVAFSGNTNLTTIRVPWASGEVSGAPWGATNATITYGYTA